MFCNPEIKELAEHGTTLPPNMQGLTDEQIEELKLKDEWEDKCVPSGGSVFCKDDMGCRNGHGRYQVHLVSNFELNFSSKSLHVVCSNQFSVYLYSP